MAASTRYGKAFDGLALDWAVWENEHDKLHPDRSQCGGVGKCSMMRRAHGLELDIVEALTEWRRRG